jgi:hypothetical protein
MNEMQAGWYSDPKGTFLYRYWNGAQWTDQVSNGGTHSGIDPDPVSPAMITTPPAPGTAAPATTPEPQPTIQVTQARGSSFGTILAVILAIAAIVLVVALIANLGDDSSSTGTDAPPATEAPAETSE